MWTAFLQRVAVRIVPQRFASPATFEAQHGHRGGVLEACERFCPHPKETQLCNSPGCSAASTTPGSAG
jgi:hypothetical protein